MQRTVGRGAAPPSLMEEDSTDESEREDDDYKASTARYGALIKRTLRNLGPDLESQIADDVMGASSPSHARGLPNGAGQRQQQKASATTGVRLLVKRRVSSFGLAAGRHRRGVRFAAVRR